MGNYDKITIVVNNKQPRKESKTMTKLKMIETLKRQYANAHDRMMKCKSCEKLYIQYYEERQATGRILVECGFMTNNELQHYLDELNKEYDFTY